MDGDCDEGEMLIRNVIDNLEMLKRRWGGRGNNNFVTLNVFFFRFL